MSSSIGATPSVTQGSGTEAAAVQPPQEQHRVDPEKEAFITQISNLVIKSAKAGKPVPSLDYYKLTSEQSLKLQNIPFVRSISFLELAIRTEAIDRELRIEYLRTQGSVYLPPEIDAVFPDMKCPRKTAVDVAGKYLPANYVWEEQTDHMFVACHCPKDPALFWQFIQENGFDIIDVTPEQIPFSGIGPAKQPLLKIALDTSNPILKLNYLILKIETSLGKKTLVLDQANQGWEGTVITAYFLKQQIARGRVVLQDIGNPLVDLISLLKKQCGPDFVKTEAQFDLLYDFAVILLTKPKLFNLKTWYA